MCDIDGALSQARAPGSLAPARLPDSGMDACATRDCGVGRANTTD